MFGNSIASNDDKSDLDYNSLTYMASSHFDCIENYKVAECRIGRGGFGDVYKAKSIFSRQEVAIKFIDKKIIQARPECVRRVLQEVAIHSRLKHANIIEVYSYFEDDSYIYLVLELCPFGDLNSILKKYKRGFHELKVHRYMCQIIEGILYLQKHGIMHRDLTLSNMLLTQDDVVKIADFGLATQLSDPNEKHYTMCGTPNYISPEVLKSEAHGLESDVWSVGCMLYAMLTGRPPFEADVVEDTLARVRSGHYEVPRDLSEVAKSLIIMLLQKNPNDRLKLRNIFSHPFFVKYENRRENYDREVSVDSGRDTMHGSSLNNSGSQTAFKNDGSPVINYTALASPDDHGQKISDLFNRQLRNWESDKQIGNYEEVMSPLIEKAFNSSSVSSAFLANTSFLSHSMASSSSSPSGNFRNVDNNDEYQFYESPNVMAYAGVHNGSKFSKAEFFAEQNTNRPISEPMKTSSNRYLDIYESIKRSQDVDFGDEMKKSFENLSNPKTGRDMTPSLRSHSVGNLRRKKADVNRVWTTVDIDIDSNPTNQKAKKLSPSIFFTTARLRPRRHKTKHAVITILEDGWVCAEFFKPEEGREVVKKLMKINPDGKEIYISDVRDGRETSYMTPFMASIQGESMSFMPESLPQRWRKEFEYVTNFIECVRSNTPKVTHYTDRATCTLMENLPVADFRAEFHSGCKFLMTTEVTKIFQPDGTFVTLNPKGSITHLSPEMQKMWRHAKEAHRKCREHEALLSQSTKDSNIPTFPVTFGIKNCLVNLTSPGNNISPCSTNSSEPSTSKSKPSSLSDSLSLSQHMRRSASLHSDIPISPQPTLENLNDTIASSPHFHSNPQTDDLGKIGHSSERQSPHPQRTKSLSSLSHNNRTSVRIRKCISIPGVLTAYELSNGIVLIKNVDGSEIAVHPDCFQITFPDKTIKRLSLLDNIQVPQHIVQKLKDLPLVMSKLERASRLTESREVPDDLFL